MMEVILSDFERTVEDTGKAEDKAAREFTELERETMVSVGTKTAAQTQYTEERATATTNIDTDSSEILSKQKLMDAAVEALMKLYPACNDARSPEEKYAEREAKRESEIA